MAGIGYNESALQNVYNSLNTSRGKVAETVANVIQTKILTPIGDAWWAKEAVEYWKGNADGKGFQPAVEKCAKKINEAYVKFAEAVNKSVEHWAKNTGSDVKVAPVKSASDNDFKINLNYDCILAKRQDGFVGIDEDGANAVVNSLKVAQNDIKSELGKLASKLDGVDTLFLGKKQAENVQKCFKAVNEAIAELFSFFTESGDKGKSLKQVIDAYIKKYNEVAEDINKSFKTNE